MSDPGVAGDLRFYRPASLRAEIALSLVPTGLLLVTAVGLTLRSPLYALALVPIAVVLAVLSVRLWRWGVHETPNGILGLAGGYQCGSVQLDWVQMRRFSYARVGAREHLIVETTDGARRIVRGASRRMVWAGGTTDDFARLLTERLQERVRPLSTRAAERPHRQAT